MSSAPIHVLLIEDNPGDARLLRELLQETGSSQFELVHADRFSEALARLSERRFAKPVNGSVCDSCCVCSNRVALEMTAAACSLTRPSMRRCSSVKQPGTV